MTESLFQMLVLNSHVLSSHKGDWTKTFSVGVAQKESLLISRISSTLENNYLKTFSVRR